MSIVSANPVTLATQRSHAEMREATLAARKSLDDFFHAFHHRQPNQKDFLVQVFFRHRQHVEHVWMDNLDLSSTAFSGTLMENPALANVAGGQRRTFARDRITDWMYIEDGKTVGAYTARLRGKHTKVQRLSGLRRILKLTRMD